MGIKVNTIVTLDNDDCYVVLNETMYQGSKYFLMMGLDDKKEIISSKVVIFKEAIEGLDVYVEIVDDPLFIAKLTKLLKDQI